MGLFVNSIPVAWWAWISPTLAHKAEAGGELMAAVVQMAIMTGAAGSRFLYNPCGCRCTFRVAAAIQFAADVTVDLAHSGPGTTHAAT